MKSESLRNILKEPSVDFDPVGHTYTNRNTGELYVGTTTVSDAWDKAFFLAPWTAKMMAEELKSKIKDIGLMFQDNPNAQKDFEKIVDEAKGAANRFSEKAKFDGSAAHDWIEQVISLKIAEGAPKLPPLPASKEAANAVTAFINWAKRENAVWIASEEVVCSDEYRIGGKLDALASFNGVPFLVDFKTSSQISESYLLQCAGYDIMLREMGFQVAGYKIVRIPKDGKPVETLTVTKREDMDFFRKTFLMQREAHRFYVLMQSKFKDERGKMKIDIPEEKVDKNNTSQENGSSKKSVRKSASGRKNQKAVSPSGGAA